MTRSRARSFTLIELLVVIAIIAILASILLPSLRKAMDNAKRAQCIGNLKNISIGVNLYADDNDSYFPIDGGGMGVTGAGVAIPAGTRFQNAMRYGGGWYSSTGNGGAWGSLWDTLLVHLYFGGDGKIFYCPSDPGGNNPGNDTTLTTRGWGLSICDYCGWRGPSYAVQYYHAYFGVTYYGTYSTTFYRGFRLEQLLRYGQADLMLLADWQNTYWGRFYNSNRAGLAQNPAAMSHGNGMNFIAPDISVRSRDLGSISNSNDCWLPNRLP